MVQINFALREVNCKIVYYGPGLSGKTTNIEVVHLKAPEANKGELTSIATEGDRTLFFDYMPLDLGNIAGMRTKFQLYTVPGQVYYNSTRKLVLQGVDGIIFVADSQADKIEENLESLENLKNNLIEAGKQLDELPMLIQFNKRDLPGALDIDTLNQKLNPRGLPTFEAVANTGEGVFPTLKALSSLVLESLSKQRNAASSRPIARAAATPAAVPAAVPAAAAAGATQSAPAAQAAPAAPVAPPPTSLPPQAGALPEQGAPAAASAPPPTVSAPPSAAPQAGMAEPAPVASAPAALAPGKKKSGAQKKKKKGAGKKRQLPKARAPVRRTGKVQLQSASISNSRGKIFTLVALGIVVFGALGLILNSFGVI